MKASAHGADEREDIDVVIDTKENIGVFIRARRERSAVTEQRMMRELLRVIRGEKQDNQAPGEQQRELNPCG